MGPLRIDFLNDWTAISDAAWEQVVAASPTRTIFQTKAWQHAWWETFGRGKLLLIAAHQNQRIVALAPLFADQGMVFFVGSGGSDYLDFIGDAGRRPAMLREMLQLARSCAPGFVGFRFYHVPDESPTGQLLIQCGTEIDLTCFDEGSLEAPRLRFEDWPAGKRAPAEKKSLIRHERAMQALGRLEVDHFTDASEIRPWLTAFFEQHVTRWANTPFPSLFGEEQQRQFYCRLNESLGSRGWLRFSRVALDGRPVAFHFGFLYQDNFLWYKPSFDIHHARQSPGEVLLRRLLLHALECRVAAFDFGLGDEPFKRRFATETRRVRTWGLYASTESR